MAKHKQKVFVGMTPKKSLRDSTGQGGSVLRRKKSLVFVGMSGGVDSSVAAYLLKKQGYEVIGVFIRGYNIDNCQEKDAEDARRVAEHLDIPFYVWDFEREYKKKVVDYMIQGYKKGITPNPDVMCNREIKFGIFFDRAMKLGADFVATGHYVRKIGNTLYAGLDKNKDQSYFLWTLTKKQISKSLFPIGDYLKPEVRKIAKRARISTAEKKDSQGICFLGMVDIKDFLKKYIPEKKGMVLNLKGEKIGEHKGAWFYTIGQRGGVGNLKHEKGQKNHVPLYVSKKDVKKNILVVAEGNQNSALFVQEVRLSDLVWAGPQTRTKKGISVWARVRYRQPLFKATLYKLSAANCKLVFKNPQKFVASGQSAVFYGKDGRMLGGGVIV